MMAKVGTFFSRMGLKNAPISSEIHETDESVVGKTFSPELFKAEFAELGWDMEIFTLADGKILRFRKIPGEEYRIPDGSDAKKGAVW